MQVTIDSGEVWRTTIRPAEAGWDGVKHLSLIPIDIPDELWAEYEQARTAYAAVLNSIVSTYGESDRVDTPESRAQWERDMALARQEMSEDDALFDWRSMSNPDEFTALLLPTVGEREEWMASNHGPAWRSMVEAAEKREKENA